jgi:3-phenylpropionate/cinnamic acid dioxygenase small subunit
MSDATDQIRNLLHRYARAVDTGDFDALAGIFEHARFRTVLGDADPAPNGPQGAEVTAMFKNSIILYEDGTPRTRHVVTNSIIEVEENGGTATAHSYLTTLQQVPGHPIEIIATACYEDRFQRMGNTWHFADRIVRRSSMDGVERDFIGDMSRHLRAPLTTS